MSKKQIPIEDRKVKISITINRELNEILNLNTNNKSKFIEDLLSKTLK